MTSTEDQRENGKKHGKRHIDPPATWDFLGLVNDETEAEILKERFIRIMASKMFVFKYGPYEFRGLIAHRKNRILGLAKKVQTEIGVKVFLLPIDLFDRLIIEINGFTVFTCKITNMKFDNDCLDYTSELGFIKCLEVVNSIKRDILNESEPCADPIVLMTKSIF